MFSHYAREEGKLRRWPISGRYLLSVGALVLRSNSYADAKGWNDLVHAFTESLKHPSSDKMILLLHKAIPGSHRRWSDHVFPVAYDTLDGVPKLLISKVPSTVRSGITRIPQQQHHVEGVAEGQFDHDRHPQSTPIDAPRKEVSDTKAAKVNRSDSNHEQEYDKIRVKAAKVIQSAYHAYRHRLERKQVIAARKIQAAYHRYLTRRDIVRNGIDEIQVRFWTLLRERSREMKWPKDSRYYLLFRVPLGDILVCLNTIGKFLTSSKKEVNKRITDTENKGQWCFVKAGDQYRYDRVGWVLCSGSDKSSRKLLRRTITLQKKLGPTSILHEKQSVTELQKAVQEAKVILESLDTLPGSTATRDKIKKRWDRGYKWIFEKHRTGVEA